ncbi:MAG TPA: hypothetical protein PLB80_06535 [Methanoculleus sp.]|jgi:hypothetical protein|nr:hypothetical protein [Methanoculleus sp.]
MAEPETKKTAKAGEKPGPGRYICIDCGREIKIDSTDQDLVRCPSCACEMYNCLPMTHIRPDIKTPEDVMNPPERKKPGKS